jgi:hypothetical protein
VITKQQGEFSVYQIILLLKRWKWLFIGTVLVVLAFGSLYIKSKKPTYLSIATIQVKNNYKLLPGYDEDGQVTIRKIMLKYGANPRYVLNGQQLQPGVLQLSVSAPTAKEAYDSLSKIATGFLKEKNKPSDILLKEYTTKLSNVQEELNKVELSLKNSKPVVSGSIEKLVSSSQQVQLQSLKVSFEGQIFGLKQDILLLNLCKTKIISGPTIENTPVGASNRTSIGLMLIFGIFLGVGVVFIADLLFNTKAKKLVDNAKE